MDLQQLTVEVTETVSSMPKRADFSNQESYVTAKDRWSEENEVRFDIVDNLGDDEVLAIAGEIRQQVGLGELASGRGVFASGEPEVSRFKDASRLLFFLEAALRGEKNELTPKTWEELDRTIQVVIAKAAIMDWIEIELRRCA